MQFTLALLAAAASGAAAATASIGSIVSLTAAAPSGCATSYSSSFEITVVLPSAAKKRDVNSVVKRDTCSTDGILVATLSDGILTDSKGRIGSIVANHQFQFDGPPAQAGFIYDAGWSVCSNGSLALGGSSIFYQCLSGDFYNLYDEDIGSQCEEVLIDVIPCTSSSSASVTAAAETTDGQVTAASATTAAASQITDGQVQASSAVSATVAAVSQISDGQIQASSVVTAAAVSTSKVSAVSQISDGQVQAASALPAPVSQYTDGQIQVTASPAKVTAAAVATSAASSSMTTSYGAAVSQISDGQIQATAAGTASASKASTTASATAAFTGAASSMNVITPLMAGVAAVIALAM